MGHDDDEIIAHGVIAIPAVVLKRPPEEVEDDPEWGMAQITYDAFVPPTDETNLPNFMEPSFTLTPADHIEGIPTWTQTSVIIGNTTKAKPPSITVSEFRKLAGTEEEE